MELDLSNPVKLFLAQEKAMSISVKILDYEYA